MFDFDGTLADTFSWFVRVFDQVADRFSFKRLDRSAIETLRGLDARQIMRLHQIPSWKVPFIARHAQGLMKNSHGELSLFPGVSQALAGLSAEGITMAVVTSNSWSNVAGILGPDNLAFFKHFECGVGMFGKAAKLRRLVKRLGVGAGRALFIGDEIRDAEAAKKAGVAFGAVAWGYARPEALAAQGPQEFFTRVEDLGLLRADPHVAA